MDKLDFGYYNMDCMAGMKLFPDKYFDVAIVDPPYGINAPNMAMGTNKSRTKNGYPSESTASRLKRSGQVKEWDSKPPTEEYFKELFRVSKIRLYGAEIISICHQQSALLYGIRCSRGMPFHKRRLRGLLTISRQNCSDTQTLAEQIQRSASIQPRSQ